MYGAHETGRLQMHLSRAWYFQKHIRCAPSHGVDIKTILVLSLKKVKQYAREFPYHMIQSVHLFRSYFISMVKSHHEYI